MRAGVALCIALAVCGLGTGAAARAEDSGIAATLGTNHEALFSIALDGKAGVAVGAAGDLRESADAGVSWHALAATPTPQALLGVGLDATHAIAVGQQG